MFGVLKPFYGILVSFFPQKGEGAFIRENILYILVLNYTGIIATSRWIQFQLPILLFFDRHPQLVCERVKELNYMCHTQKEHVLPGL